MAGIRSYNAVLRTLKAEHGLTHRESQHAYRTIRDRVGHAPTRTELKAHPRITREEAAKAPRSLRATDAARARTEARTAKAQAAMDRAAKRSASAKKGAETRRHKAEERRAEATAAARISEQMAEVSEWWDEGDYDGDEEPEY